MQGREHARSLTPEGMILAVKKGAALPKRFPTAFRASSLNRAGQTARLRFEALRGAGGKTPYHTRELSRLGNDLLNAERIYDFVKFVKSYPSEEQAFRAWMEGKAPEGIMKEPGKTVKDVLRSIAVGDRIQKSRRLIAEKRHLRKNERERINIDITGHSWVNDAVFESLTGKKIRTITKFQESIAFSFEFGGNITLRYRGKAYNVTKRFNQLLKN